MYLSYICNALEQPTHIYEPVDFHLLLLHRMFFLFIYLFIKALQHKCWRPVGHQVLQPANDVKFRTVCLKSCRQEKKIHDAPRQPRTCSHPIYAQTLTGVCQVIRIFSPCVFHAFISTGTLDSNKTKSMPCMITHKRYDRWMLPKGI